jgi:hypothetical protein
MHKDIKIWLVFLLISITVYNEVYSAFESINGGARAESLGGAFTACADDWNSIFYNPAGLSNMVNGEFSTFYMIPYGLKELGVKCIAGAFPLKYCGLGIMFQQMGTELYNESQFVFSLSRKTYKGLSIGLNVKFLHIGIQRYGSSSFFASDCGILYNLKDDFRFGMFISNVNKPKIYRDRIPRYYSIGISKRLISGLSLNLDVSKYEKYPEIIRFGGEMNLTKMFQLRFGICDNPRKFSGGFGFGIKNLSFNYAISDHNVLGITNQFSLTLKIM